MGNTLLISILRVLFYVVYSMRARLWYIRMFCDTLFWAMIFVDFCGMLWALKILCFSLWNSPVTPGRNLLSKELECGHEESRRNVLLEWPGSLSLWPGYGTRVWSFLGFWNFFKELWRARCVEKIKNASVWYLDAYMSRWPTTQR